MGAATVFDMAHDLSLKGLAVKRRPRQTQSRLTPTLNWKEVAALTQSIGPEIQGLFVERVVIPERANFPEGYLRHEWVIRLSGRRAEAALFFSIRPRHPYLALCLNKGPKASVAATQSPFSLNLSKMLKGAKVLGLEALPRERILVLWVTLEGTSKEKLGLVLCLIPAVPEALLVQADIRASASVFAAVNAVEKHEPANGWKIHSRSRTLTPERSTALFAPPTGSQAPEAPVVREDFFARPETFFEQIEKELKLEAFEVRMRTAERELKELIKQARERIRQSGSALKEAGREPDWQRYGELLKFSLHDLPAVNEKGERLLTDYATEATLAVPCDPKLGPSEQVEKFFQQARRKQRRAEEAKLRIETFGENLGRWESALDQKLQPGDWQALEALERLARIQPVSPSASKRSPGKGKISSWLGKTFTSKEGLMILAGRSKDENLELTFKHARGADVWLHVRGKPGAHILIPLTSGKSAGLETLLDAATLAIYYSGGEKWGKTEVDYTFKKHVRRIKDSSEASYTHNKTLILEPDPARIKRLLGGEGK